jgi:uncharacterized coiled-coil protein SlyX
VPRRRLEDRIQDLAARAVAARDPVEVNDVIHELRAALHEHADRLRKLAAKKLIVLPTGKGAVAVTGSGGTNDVAAD